MRVYSMIFRLLGAVGLFITSVIPLIGIIIAVAFYSNGNTSLRIAFVPFLCLIITLIIPCLIVGYGIMRNRTWAWVSGLLLVIIGLGIVILFNITAGETVSGGIIIWLCLLLFIIVCGLWTKRKLT